MSVYILVVCCRQIATLKVERIKARVISASYTSMFRDKLSTHISLRELCFVYMSLLLSFRAHTVSSGMSAANAACEEWIGPPQ